MAELVYLMKLFQAIIITSIIIILTFLSYILLLEAPLEVGYTSIYIYVSMVFLVLFYPIRQLMEARRLSIWLYLKALGSDLVIIGEAFFRFVLSVLKLVLDMILSLKKSHN